MSLLKVRNFWTFDLGALQLHSGVESIEITSGQEPCVEGNFTASVGRFKSVGKQDVFVCGDLRGSLYGIQAPVHEQRHYTKSSSRVAGNVTPTNQRRATTPNNDSISLSSSIVGTEDRQLLAATNLGSPVVDIKCGYFTSAIEQSIAVLTFDKLIVLKLKKRRDIDLIDAEMSERTKAQSRNQIVENLLSHEFDEYTRFELIANEIARDIVVLNSHSEGNLVSNDDEQIDELKGKDSPTSGHDRRSKKHNDEENKMARRSKQIIQQLHLPQRDKIIVQYANQFLITLIDSKKITGHFSIVDQTPTFDAQSSEISDGDQARTSHANVVKMREMSCYAGSTPMTHLSNSNDGKSSTSLVFSLTDQQIYCVPLSKLIDLSKQDIMRRVAHNLFRSNRNSAEPLVSTVDSKPSSIKVEPDQTNDVIKVNLESISDWQHELIAMPIQMQSLQRQVKSSAILGHRDELTVSQFIVMSRYFLDLFSRDGQHLWSQRFETPLIHTIAYTLEQIDKSPVDYGKQQTSGRCTDQLVCLVCTDSLSVDKSNLVIMKEDKIHWSAMLDAKPHKLWRLHLMNMSGVLALLDIMQNQLIVSYLGTNNQGGDDTSHEQDMDNSLGLNEITKLESLKEPLLESDHLLATSSLPNTQSDQRARLVFGVSLEASNKWPRVRVDVSAQVQLEQNATSVIHNIVATLIFDDLLKFELLASAATQTQFSQPSRNSAQIELGNCWPDRREPITFKGTFYLISAQNSNCGTSAMDDMETIAQQRDFYAGSALIPKTLKVTVLLSYNETHSGPLVQEESFLLPINMLSQLIHIDYSSGNGQDLADVLGNLPGYQKGPKKKNGADECPYYFADLFLKFNCDLVAVLDEFVEGDLICRGSRNEQRGTDLERRAETLGNINLLAQSLDCRLRYKSPSGMAHQSSEEMNFPVMASFGLKFENIYTSSEPKSADPLNGCDQSNVVVWVHLCDIATKESTIPEELVTRHMQDWMRYTETPKQILDAQPRTPTSDLLVVIECDRSLPVLFLMDHLVNRFECLSNFNVRSNLCLIDTNDFGTYENFYNFIKSGHNNQVAISKNLHHSLRRVFKYYYETLTRDVEELRQKLAQESCKFQIATQTTLSLSKRLPSLPDDMTQQLVHLSNLAKQYQHNLMVILGDIQMHQRLDYEFSKIPRAEAIRLRLDNNGGVLSEWPCFEQLID